MGNIRVVITDVKETENQDANGLPEGPYNATLIATNNYYPFGMLKPGQHWSTNEYRYGYNGMEMDNEWKGEGNSYDFDARIYDARIGRWLSRDPIITSDIAPYIYVSNDPIRYLDPTGAYQTDGHYWTVYLVASMLQLSNAQELAYWAEYPDTDIQGNRASERFTWALPFVQQNTHALTGGDAHNETYKTTMQIRWLASHVTPQEIGRLLHRFGDTFAHRELLPGGGRSDKMYGWSIFTWEHGATDGHKPDLIYNDPQTYLNYVAQLANVLSNTYGGNTSTFDLSKFQELAQYASTNKVSLLGIINYEVAKYQGESTFFVHQVSPSTFLGPLLGTSETLDHPSEAHISQVKATSEYLKSKGISFTTKQVFETRAGQTTGVGGNTRQVKVFLGTQFTTNE